MTRGEQQPVNHARARGCQGHPPERGRGRTSHVSGRCCWLRLLEPGVVELRGPQSQADAPRICKGRGQAQGCVEGGWLVGGCPIMMVSVAAVRCGGGRYGMMIPPCCRHAVLCSALHGICMWRPWPPAHPAWARQLRHNRQYREAQ
jgi:hypothetical protein